MKGILTTTSNVMDSEKSPSFKRYILSILLWNRSFPSWFGLILHLIAELQIIAILSNFGFDHFSSDNLNSVGSFVKNLAVYVSLKCNFDLSGSGSLTNIAFGVISVFVLLILCTTFGLIFFYFRDTSNQKILSRIWVVAGKFNFNFAFIFVHQFTLSLINYVIDDNKEPGGVYSSSTFLVIVAIVIMSISTTNGLLVSKYAYDPIKDGYLVATRTSTFAFLGFVFKFLQLLLDYLITGNSGHKKWIVAIFCVLFLGLRLVKLMIDVPFYNSSVFSIFVVLAFIQQVQAVLNVVWLVIDSRRQDISSVMVVYSHIILGLIFAQLGKSFVYKTVWGYLLSKDQSPKTESEFFKALFTLDKVLKTGCKKNLLPLARSDSEYEIAFNQLVSNHAKSCDDAQCGCRVLLISSALDSDKPLSSLKGCDLEKFQFEFVRDFYIKGMKSIKKNAFLKIQLVNFLAQEDENALSSAVYLLNTISSESLGLENRILVSKLQDKIGNKMKTAFMVENSGFNVKQIVDYYTLKQSLRTGIAANTKLFTEFWEIYRKPNPPIMKMLQQNIKINQDAEKVAKTWKELLSNFSKMCYRDYIIYALYMQLIRNAPYTAQTLLNRYFSLVALRLNLQGLAGKQAEAFLEEENILLYVSLNQKNFGNISFVSQNVEKLGYSINQLTNKSIGLLMSPFFAKKHHKFLMNEVAQNTKTSIMNKELKVFVRANNGFILPAKLFILPFPYLDNGFYCLAVIKVMKGLDDYIFMLPDGKIEAFSEALGNKLNLDPNNVGLYFINEVCQDSSKIFRYVREHQASENTKEDNTLQKNSTNPFFSATATKNFETITINDTDSMMNPLNSPGSQIASPMASPMTSPIRSVRFGTSQAKSLRNPNSSTLRVTALGETLNEVVEKAEDFETKGVKLRFDKYSKSKGMRSFGSEITIDITISAIEYKGEFIYILKAQNFQEEMDQKSVLLPSIKNSGRGKTIGDSAIIEESFLDMSIPTDIFIYDIPPSRINKGETRIDSNLKFTSTGIDQTQISQVVKLKQNFMPSIVDNISKSQTFSKGSHKQKRKELVKGTQIREEVKDHLQNQRLNLIQTLNPQFEVESTSVQSGSRGMLALARTEKNIYYTGGVTSYKMVKLSIIGFLLVSIGLFIYYQIQGNHNFSLLVSNVDVLANSIMRLFQSVELKRRATVIRLIEIGIVDRDRNLIPNFDALLVSDFLGVASTMSVLNNKLRSSMYQFDDRQQRVFYEPIQVTQTDPLGLLPTENGFDLCSQLVSAAMRLYGALPGVPDVDNPDLNFIFNNTINGFVVHSERLFDLLKQEDQDIVQQMRNLLIYILIGLVVAGVAVILVLIRSEILFIRKKMLFFDHFLRMSEHEVDQVISKANKFHELLNDNNHTEEEIMNKMQEAAFTVVHFEKKTNNTRNSSSKNSSLRKKNGNFKAINKDSWLGVLFLIFFISTFWLTYSILCIFFVQRENSLGRLKNYIIDSNTYLTRISEGITMLYLYVGGGDTETNITIRNIPLTVEWENNMEILLDSNDFFVDIMKHDFGNYAETVKTIGSGDLCTLVTTYIDDCYIDGHGSTQGGLISLTNYFVINVNALRNAYDVSNQTLAAKSEIYAAPLFSALERLYFGPIIFCYQMLASIAEEVFLRAVDDFKKVVLILNIVSMVIFIILARIYWVTGLRRMQAEKRYFREILRNIPLNLIVQNKYLQNYMLKSFKEK